MDVEFRRRWISALLSGKYVQGQEALKIVSVDTEGNVTAISYCCIGVACDLYNSSEWEGPGPGYTRFLTGEIQLGWGSLDASDTSNLEFISDEDAGVLSSLNDAGFSFEEIAAVIKAGITPQGETLFFEMSTSPEEL